MALLKNKRTGKTINVLIANNFLARILGLSWKKEKKNMFFIMPYKKKWSFWMIGMLYPLRICFLDENKLVLEIQRATPLSLNLKTWKVYSPKHACKYILEISDNFKIKERDKIYIQTFTM